MEQLFRFVQKIVQKLLDLIRLDTFEAFNGLRVEELLHDPPLTTPLLPVTQNIHHFPPPKPVLTEKSKEVPEMKYSHFSPDERCRPVRVRR